MGLGRDRLPWRTRHIQKPANCYQQGAPPRRSDRPDPDDRYVRGELLAPVKDPELYGDVGREPSPKPSWIAHKFISNLSLSE